MKTTGIRTNGHPSRAAAIRAYQADHPTAGPAEIASALGCTVRDVWVHQALERRNKERDKHRNWLHGFGDAMLDLCKVGRVSLVREMMYSRGLTMKDMRDSGVPCTEELATFLLENVGG